MLIFKKKYYLFVENTREFNLNLIKIKNKFNIIYRNLTTKESIEDLRDYRKKCKKNGVNFFVANDTKLLSKINADVDYLYHRKEALKYLIELDKKISNEEISFLYPLPCNKCNLEYVYSRTNLTNPS